MHKSIKLRIYPNKTQIHIINRIMGACRFAYNEMIAYNRLVYVKEKRFVNYYEFSKVLNELKHSDDEHYSWLCDIKATKAIKDSLKQCQLAYNRAFDKLRDGKFEFPRFKSKKHIHNESFYFIKDSVHFNTLNENIIKLPYLKYTRISNPRDLPTEEDLVSGRIIRENNKYYVMFVYNYHKEYDNEFRGEPLGIDLGISKYITAVYPGVLKSSSARIYTASHFIHQKNYMDTKTKIKKIQQVISNKAETNYGKLLNNYLDRHHGEYPNERTQKIMKGESYNTTQIRKLYYKLRILHERLTNIRKDYIMRLVNTLVVKLKPKYITIEDLNVSKMLQKKSFNRLHEHIQESAWYYFRKCLEVKCNQYNIELRVADKFYASSKKCCMCGKKHPMNLSKRIMICGNCGNYMDRDVNAAFNLLYTTHYHVI